MALVPFNLLYSSVSCTEKSAFPNAESCREFIPFILMGPAPGDLTRKGWSLSLFVNMGEGFLSPPFFSSDLFSTPLSQNFFREFPFSSARVVWSQIEIQLSRVDEAE